ncbi:HNH/McrA nuclease domain containing protein [Halapricum desulfuricans]|uniref:HNH/McrA nuclease domain containing protein n=2 Tax=Halapricum desulfuricans TaxID=2841257 RepID=A0A897NNV8_9EURY|nr:HNH/McrA nuclease domain containing protein [Halapricum desulfuricans]
MDMDNLVSCYFCGDAVDAQLEAYPLVTSDSVETGTSVVLCPSCRRKLTAVVEEVLDAATESPDSQSVDLDGDPLETLEASAPDAMAAADSASVDSLGDESSDGSGDPADGHDADDVQADENDVQIDENDDNETRIAGGSESETAVLDDGETTDSGDSEGTVGQTGTADDDFRRSEYNKVVRLLQNREFPVEIEEITVVARSAYGIDRDTTHAILSALIENEILEDRGDELVRA